MNKNRYPLALGSIIAVLVLAGCGRTQTPVATLTPFAISSSTAEQIQPATSTPPQMETSPPATPTQNILQMSQQWRVAYFVEDPVQICVMNGDNTNRSCLALNEENFASGYAAAGFLALSPDGAKVAYATECNIYIWTIGRDVVPLRNEGVCGIFRQLQWSPDGNSIIYISEELQRTCPYCQAYFGDIFISSLDGAVHRALTEDLDGSSHWPNWSPDGKHIAFSRHFTEDLQSNDLPNEEIMVIPAEGGSAVNLSNHSAVDTRPQWSPDGRQMAFLSDRNEDKLMDLYLMSPGGEDLRVVAELRSPHRWPYNGAYFFWLSNSTHMIHDNLLIDTTTGQIEVVELPFGSSYGSWAMSPQSEIVSAVPNLTQTSSTSPCAANWTRLRPGIYAVVTGGSNDPPNRVREAADASAKIIHQIYPGTILRVLEGPVCANGLVFWKVENETIPGGVGWTAEGDMQEYFMEPIR